MSFYRLILIAQVYPQNSSASQTRAISSQSQKSANLAQAETKADEAVGNR